MVNRLGNGRINISQTQIRGREPRVHFQHATFMTAAFKFPGDEGIKNFFGGFDGCLVTTQAQHIAIIVPAHQRCIIFVLGLAGAHAGDFIGDDANADAAGAAQHAQFRAAIGDGLGRRLREIGIIVRRIFCFGAEIQHGQAALQQILLERLLHFKAAVIRAEREVHDRRLFRRGSGPKSCVVPYISRGTRCPVRSGRGIPHRFQTGCQSGR